MAYEDEKKGELETLLNDILEDKNTNLTPENLKKGVTVLGVDGNYIGTDTSDATATNEDVLEGKTAYAKGQKLTGTLRVEDVDSVLDMFPSIETEISEEIDIKDAVENSFNDLSIYGNSKQESTEGYNLFDYLNNIRNTSRNNITVDKDDKMGYIIVNGTPNANYANIVDSLNITDLLEDKQTYSLKQENANNLSINYIYSQIIIDNKETLQKQYIGTRTTFKQTFTVDKTTYNYYANIQTGTIENTGTLNNFKTRFMIYKGTDDKPFEPYTGGKASPNPDYPQEIESIKDSIAFKRIGKNIISINEKVGSGQIQLIINTDGTSKALQPFKLKKGDKVTISYKMSNTQILNKSFLCTRKGDISYNYPFNGTTGTITIENDIDYIGLVVYLTEVVDSNFKIYDIQIEKGTEATEYEPYNEDVYTLPVQQEMLEEDYIKDVEYHTWGKIILTGNENNWNWNPNDKPRVSLLIDDSGIEILRQVIISNYFKYTGTQYIDGVGIGFIYNRFLFLYYPENISSLDDWKSWLQEKYNSGNPVVVYYKLNTPIELPCTTEQTTVLNKLEQFYLQDGINHIFSDDDLSPKFKLKYYRDINMMLESEIINNAESKFNIFYDSKVEEFNTNADEKLKGYNTNADNKLEKYNTNATSKINEYDTNADEKLEEYNTNATSKINEYNTNANEKLEEFNNNATEKTTAYNNNAEDKLNEYNTNATNKINEYNTNAEAILKILPKTETEVLEEIDIDDAGESSFNKLSVFGNSRQESTTGAAKVDFGAFAGDYSDEQMEIKIDENGIISLKGTVSAYYSKKIGTITKNMFSAGNNIYYARSNNTNNGVIFIQAIGSISFVSNNNSPSFEITDESQESDLYVVVNYLESGILNVNETLYPMISLESNALYEPYTGGNLSPNPDYPQEIESIGNRDTFLLEKDAKLKQYINAKINQSFALGESERTKVFQNVLKVKSGKKYTIAWTKNTVLDNVVRQCVITNDSNIVVQEFMITPDTEQCLFTANADGMLSIGLDLNSTAVKISKEYGEITFKRIGKNIFNKNNDFFDNFYIDPLNKKIVYSIYGNSVIVKCKANINYTVSRKSILVKDFVVGSVAEYPVDGTPTINVVNGRDKLNITINSGENAKYLVAYIMWSNEGSLQDVLDSIQIEEGSVSTEYEPYHEDVYTLPVQQEMLKINDYEDLFIKKDDGNWYEKHVIKKYIVDGENNIFSNMSVGEAFTTFNFDARSGSIFTEQEYWVICDNALCNMFKPSSLGQLLIAKNNIEYVNRFCTWGSYAKFSFENNKFASIDEANQYLSELNTNNKPLILYVALKTPEEILCTPEQVEVLNKLEQFPLQKGINHIFSDDELSPKFKLMYYQDMNILLDKINKNIADVSAQLL